MMTYKPSGYTPLLDNEQEAIQRMIEGQEALVEIEGWGYHSSPIITVGDKRVQVRFPMEFTKPSIIMPVYNFTLILRLRDGREVFRDTKSVVYGGQPLGVHAGLMIDLVWDIALDKVSKEFQNIFIPGLKGKTAMEIDKGKRL